MKYGVGKWVQILETGLLPGKLIQQLNGQAQRLLGQQSLAGEPQLISEMLLRDFLCSSVRACFAPPYRLPCSALHGLQRQVHLLNCQFCPHTSFISCPLHRTM